MIEWVFSKSFSSAPDWSCLRIIIQHKKSGSWCMAFRLHIYNWHWNKKIGEYIWLLPLSALFSSPQYYRKSSLLLPYEWIGISWCYKSTGNKIILFIPDDCKFSANSSFQMSVNLFAEKIVLLQQACYNHTSFFFLEKTIVLVDPICSARSPGEPQRPHQEDVEELQMLLEGEVLQQAWSFGEKLQIRNKNLKSLWFIEKSSVFRIYNCV